MTQGRANPKIPTLQRMSSRPGDTTAASLTAGNMDTPHISLIHVPAVGCRVPPPPRWDPTPHTATPTLQQPHGPTKNARLKHKRLAWWLRQFEAQSHESRRSAPSSSLNPTQPLTHEVHVLGLCRHSEPEYPHCHLQCHSFSHPPQPSNAAHFSCWPTLGSRTNSHLRISEAQPYQNKARLLTADIDARRLRGGTVSSRAAGISALSSMASSSVTLCATEHEDTLKLLTVTGIISPFTVTTS